MPGRQRCLRFTLRWPKLQTGSPNGCLKLDSQANFWWANHKIPCSFCNFRVVENAGFSKLKTQFSCFKTRLVWVSSVFPVLSCHATLLSIVWWSKSAVIEEDLDFERFFKPLKGLDSSLYSINTVIDHWIFVNSTSTQITNPSEQQKANLMVSSGYTYTSEIILWTPKFY